MDRIERVRTMEKAMDEVREAIEALRDALGRYEDVQETADRLEEYLAGDWMDDRDADERGELPSGMKRGGLSEDALYDLLADNDDTAVSLIETAARIMRG